MSAMMRNSIRRLIFLLSGGSLCWGINCVAFDGQIRAYGGRTGAEVGLIYTVGTNLMRVQVTGTNSANAIDVVDLVSGQVTLIQPMNNTFLRFAPGAQNANGLPPGIGPRSRHGDPGAGAQPPRPSAGIGPTNMPGLPPSGGLPPGVGPQAQAGNPTAAPAMPGMPALPGGLPPGIGPQAHADATAAVPAMPAMPMMAMMPPGGGLELKAKGEKTNLLNYACDRYEIRQNEQTMEIWATSQLPPFQAYLAFQPPGVLPPMIEEQWARLVAAKKLFPLSAIMRSDAGVERYRFVVQSITPRLLTPAEVRGFEIPDGYVELQPRPF